MLKRKSDLIWIAIELLCLILLLPGCFKKEELVQSFYGEDIYEDVTQIENDREYRSGLLSLSPGVYQAKVWASLAEGQTMYVEVMSDTSYYKSLRGNGVAVFSGDDYIDFNVYVTDKVPEAYVYCRFMGSGAETLINLELYRTNQGNRVLFFIVLLIFGVVDFLVEFRRRILAGVVSRKKQVVFWGLAAGVLIAYFPYLTDYFSIGADSLFHWTRIVELKESLEQGAALPVRIQSEWVCGHGYAVSLFYGDFFLFIPVALQWFGFSMMTSYKMFIFLLLTATAVIAYHAFYQCMREEYAALFGSLIYLIMPYHVFNIYNRGALGECLAMTFLPLVCCGMYLLYTEKPTSRNYKKYKWYIVWGMSAVLQSHMISTEMTAVFMAVFCACFWRKTFRRETFMQLLQATGIVIFINMWFWLPLIYMMNGDVYHLQSITTQAVQDRGLYLASILQLLPNMGGSQTGIMNCEPVQIGAGAMILLIIYVLWRVKGRSGSKACTVSAIFSISTIVMSTRYLPWDVLITIPGIGYIISSLQFPSRWMVLASVFVSLFAGFWFLYIEQGQSKLLKVTVAVSAVVAVASAVYHVNDIAYESRATYLYAGENMGTISVGNGEYLLEEVGDFALDMYYHDPVAEEGLSWLAEEIKGTDVTIFLENHTQDIRYIELPLMGYKGYGIRALDTQEEAEALPYITEDVGTHGDLQIAVPAGYTGRIKVSYQGLPLFHAAEAISLVSLAGIFIVYLYRKRKKLLYGNENRERS